ncbi:hypothetical protein DFA_09803 [Cavenderia fasciculata]|uniref:Late endosomal/lysosomal adaptor and MAPK and MTOR activator 5 n=1 Tax=Cavenderia fasciculata TaxID=261658 RepID=F4QAR5_CACFS|nr:uncharacterized protein DFA_09803 [Cavenderia fasciculata]EGG14983.1 hypothetical protein DFA_09803 [Cavenderia fasciculata]|eukprot:XP_004351703.1 hypothetical protein DFA_09803 [Cavenderia fasciculata]
MDKQVADVINQCSHTVGVTGLVVVDDSGLCLKAHGSANSSTAGYYKSLVDKSKTLRNSNEVPNITIETDSSNIFIQGNDQITLGIHKLP